MKTNGKLLLVKILSAVIFIEIVVLANYYLIQPNINKCESPYGITIQCRDEEYVKLCLQELDKIPDRILADFAENGWRLKIGENYLEKVRFAYNNTKIMGMTIDGCKCIVVASDAEILHEFGHYLYGRISEKSDFFAIYSIDCNNADMPGYYTSSVEEYFAQCFALYIDGYDFDGIENTKQYFDNLQHNKWGIMK